MKTICTTAGVIVGLFLVSAARAQAPSTKPASERDTYLQKLKALPTEKLADASQVQPLLAALYAADRRADGTADDPLYSNQAVRAHLMHQQLQAILADRFAAARAELALHRKWAGMVHSPKPVFAAADELLKTTAPATTADTLKAIAALQDMDRQLIPLQPAPAAEQFKKMRFDNGYMVPSDAQLQILASHLKNKKISIITKIESVGSPDDEKPETVCKTRDGNYVFRFPWKDKNSPPFGKAGVGHFVTFSGTVIDISDPAHHEFQIERAGW